MLPTGFDPLDEVLAGGIRHGEVVLLGGKPGVGKTIASLQWARSMAQRGIVVVYLCYEHDEVTLLTRLLSCELGEMLAADAGRSAPGTTSSRPASATSPPAPSRLREALESDPLLDEAHRRLAAYADRLVLVTGSGAHTNVPAIGDVTRRFDGQPVALFVDYVQKVPVYPAIPARANGSGASSRASRSWPSTRSWSSSPSPPPTRRASTPAACTSRHFRGSTALAYEADAIVVLNEKLAIVSRAHVAHSPTRAEEFHRQVVFSVEKNRNGTPDVNLEFEKDFAHYRFHPRGRWVAERLWTEGSIEQ